MMVVMTRLLALALVLAALLALGGCGGSGGSDAAPTDTSSVPPPPTPTPPPTTELSAALAAVAVGPASRTLFLFGDEQALRRLAHAPASVTRLGTTQLDQRWFGLVGFGAPAFVDAAPQLPALTGIDLYRADRSITLGRAPHSATRLDGPRLERARIAAALGRLGAQMRIPNGPLAGRIVFALGSEGSIHRDGPLGHLGLVTALDRAVVLPSRFAAGGYYEPLSETLGNGPSLGEVPTYARAASCLGDPVAALLERTSAGLVALGVDRPAPHPRQVAETLCVVGSDAQLGGVERALRAALPGGSAPARALRARVASATVARAGGFVRAALRLAPSERAGLLFGLRASGALDRLLAGRPL